MIGNLGPCEECTGRLELIVHCGEGRVHHVLAAVPAYYLVSSAGLAWTPRPC